MNKFQVVFHTDTNYSMKIETVEADNKGEAVSKLRERFGKIVVYGITKIHST